MSVQNEEIIRKEAEIKAKRREKKKRPKMKVSGADVKKLQKIIKDKK